MVEFRHSNNTITVYTCPQTAHYGKALRKHIGIAGSLGALQLHGVGFDPEP